MRKHLWLLLMIFAVNAPVAMARRKSVRRTTTEKVRKAPVQTAPVRVAPMRVPREATDLEKPITGENFSMPQTVIETTRYARLAAYRLTDGRSEAIVVPSLGRVMSFKLLGGDNWLWNAPDPVGSYGPWKNWGGEKTWPAPQSQWSRLGGKNDNWPPPAAWDGEPHIASIVNDSKKGPMLRTTSPLAPNVNARLVREYRFDNGDFVVTQIVEKTVGEPVTFSIWSIAQINFPDAVYMPLRADSVYKNNWVWQGEPFAGANLRNASETLLEIRPAVSQAAKGFKIGADADVSSLIAVKDGMALRLRSSLPKGEYPDGVPGHGTPVEIFVSGDKKAHYVEMELLSPLLKFSAGSRFRHTIRWSLLPLAHKSMDDEELPVEIEALLRAS